MGPSTRFSRLSFLFIFSANLVPQIAAFTQCYYPDGSVPVDYIWEPCKGSGGHSSCCIPTEGDVCQDNGLCWYPGLNNTFRGACTDRTWNDPACTKDICITGNEDTWAWVSPCSSNDGDVSFACGHVEDGVKVMGNCTAGATTHYEFFRTVETTTSKPTRYTSPPPLDTAKFTVYTETYTTVVPAWVQTTTFTTTWQSTFTSAFAQVSGDASGSGTGPITSRPGVTAPSSSSTSTASGGGGGGGGGGITVSPGVLGAAIAGPVVALALIGFLIFYFRRKRAAKKGTDGSTRLHSSPSNAGGPPANGPVGNDQVVPYEVPANEAAGAPAAGYYGHDKKYTYGSPDGRVNGAYEMGAIGGVGGGEKGWHGVHGNVQEVHADQRQGGVQYPHATGDENPNELVSPLKTPRSPAPVYSEAAGGPVVLPVELDGGHYQRPVGSNRNGVGNA